MRYFFRRDAQARTYLLTGYYGFKNFGDDLFPMACSSAIDNLGGRAVVLSPPIVGVDAFFLVPKFFSNVYQCQGGLGKAIRFLFLLYGIVRYKNLVLAGGSTISSGSSMLMRRAQYYMSLLGLCRLYAIGVSVGPFTKEKDISFARKFINRLTYLAVRDEKSKKECEQIGVRIVPSLHNDLAGALHLNILSALNGRARPRQSKVIGISICRYESVVGLDAEVEKVRNIAISEGVAEFCLHNNYKANVLVLNGNKDIGDSGVSNRLFEYLISAGVEAEIIMYNGPIHMIDNISSCDLFLSVRLHGAIAAYLANIPFSLIEYHRKCADFLEVVRKDTATRLGGGFLTSLKVVEVLEILAKGERTVQVCPKTYSDDSLKNFEFIESEMR